MGSFLGPRSSPVLLFSVRSRQDFFPSSHPTKTRSPFFSFFDDQPVSAPIPISSLSRPVITETRLTPFSKTAPVFPSNSARTPSSLLAPVTISSPSRLLPFSLPRASSPYSNVRPGLVLPFHSCKQLNSYLAYLPSSAPTARFNWRFFFPSGRSCSERSASVFPAFFFFFYRRIVLVKAGGDSPCPIDT